MDSEIETKLREVTEENRRRLDELDIELARLKSPILYDAGSLDKRPTPESKAFERYLRKGEKGMGPDEFKTLTIGCDPSFGYACPPQLASDILHALTEGNPMEAWPGAIRRATPPSRS